MGKIADKVAAMLALGARSHEIIEMIAKMEAKEEKAELEEWRVQEAFAVFWSAYPNKVGKPDALKAFRSVLKRFTLEQIMVGLERYVHARRPDQPWLNTATFLRQERFNDQPASVTVKGLAGARQKLREEIVNDQHRDLRQEGDDPRSLRGVPRLPGF